MLGSKLIWNTVLDEVNDCMKYVTFIEDIQRSIQVILNEIICQDRIKLKLQPSPFA